jgi:hypothetical protein
MNTDTDPIQAHTELVALLNEFGVSPGAFYARRCYAYEKAVAAHSLADLRTMLSLLIDQGIKLEDLREKCPPHPPGSRFAGQKPSLMALSKLRRRFLAEIAGGSGSNHSEVKKNTGASTKTLDILIATVRKGLKQVNFNPESLAANAPALTFLIEAETARAQIRQEDARLKILGEAETRRQAELNLKAKEAVEPAEPAPAAPIKQETADEMFKRIYGKNPFKT